MTTINSFIYPNTEIILWRNWKFFTVFQIHQYHRVLNVNYITLNRVSSNKHHSVAVNTSLLYSKNRHKPRHKTMRFFVLACFQCIFSTNAYAYSFDSNALPSRKVQQFFETWVYFIYGDTKLENCLTLYQSTRTLGAQTRPRISDYWSDRWSIGRSCRLRWIPAFQKTKWICDCTASSKWKLEWFV